MEWDAPGTEGERTDRKELVCAERGITEHAYYYRLRKLRRTACDALQQTQPVQLAEIPLDGFKITPLFVFLGYFFLYFSAFIV